MAKDKNSNFKLMGFGHRVYKNFDPRAKILKKSADSLLTKMGIQPSDSDLIIHKKIFIGVDIDSLIMTEVFRYLMRLRSSNFRNKIFEPIAYNEFLKSNWRRFMFKHKHKLLYWISVLLFFRPVNFIRIINSRFSLLFPDSH